MEWNNLVEAYKNNKSISARVIKVAKGGLGVDLGGIEGYLPGSQIDMHLVLPYFHQKFIGQIFDVKVIKINPNRKNVVVSRLRVLKGE